MTQEEINHNIRASFLDRKFELVSDMKPRGDQPEAIRQLVLGLRRGEPEQVLLGVTGSGKTFTLANVIQEVQRPTLILSHNKTLAAQLFTEFKGFFPSNSVEFFISYYDYYQPEAYIAASDTYIEKDLAVNTEIEKLRLRATTSLLSGRRDVVIVSSVSCIYGIGKPEEFASHIFGIQVGDRMPRNGLLLKLVELLYSRTETDFNRGNFRVRGDTVDVFPAYDDIAIRVIFYDDEIEAISLIDPLSGRRQKELREFVLYPANLFVTSRDVLNQAIGAIQDEMMAQVDFFRASQEPLLAKRIKERTEYDLEMIRELGFCKGIENYSRHLTMRTPGSRPYCLLDYFPDDYLLVIDESHVTVPQVRGMYGGDRSRKLNLVEHAFRLPSALDNRPLKFEEFELMAHQTIFVSATPGDYELEKTGGVVVEQVVRPTGLLDPPVEVRPLWNQIDDLLEEIQRVVAHGSRVLVTTLTKHMSEELARYLAELGVSSRYIHSDIDALERVDILRDLRQGKFDVLVGVNLLREGLDLPEVTLVAILDADKEGFLRSERSFIQTAGRAARNAEGRVLLYADKITNSMQKLLDETERRRAKQMEYNRVHGIVPTTVHREIGESLHDVINPGAAAAAAEAKRISLTEGLQLAAEPDSRYWSKADLENAIAEAKKRMEAAADGLDFVAAAKHRDEMYHLQKLAKHR